MVSVLISDNGQNHPVEDYALATASAIVPSDGVNSQGIDPLRVRDMQTKMAMILRPYFEKVIDKQKANIAANPTDFTLAHEIHGFALEAAGSLHQLSKTTFLKDVASRLEWIEEVMKVIANNLATAAHVENLLHADRNPTMPEAKAYKTKFQG